MITFLFTFFVVFLVVIQICFQKLAPIIIPIFIIFIICFIKKVKKQCEMYGTKNVFRISYTGKKIEMLDYVDMMLHQIPKDRFVYKYHYFIIFLNHSGLFLFQCFDKKGIVTGNFDDAMLTCTSGKNEVHTSNPLISLTKMSKKLEERLQIPVTSYLVVDNHCQFFVDGNNIKTIFLKNVYYDMIQKREKNYGKEQLDQYGEQLQNLLSNSVNNSRIT